MAKKLWSCDTSNTRINKTGLREHRPLSMPKFQPKLICYSNPDCRINPDPNVCWIFPKMFWIHYLVGVSHFAEFSNNQAVTVWEMLINLLKSPIPQWWGKWKSDLESLSGTGAPPKVNQFFSLEGPIMTPSWNGLHCLITFPVILLTEWRTNIRKGQSSDLHLVGGGNKEAQCPVFKTSTDQCMTHLYWPMKTLHCQCHFHRCGRRMKNGHHWNLSSDHSVRYKRSHHQQFSNYIMQLNLVRL